MSMEISLDEIKYCLAFAEGKKFLPNVKNADFPESLLPSHKEFYDTWQRFMSLLSPILDLAIYDEFYSFLGDTAYFRYRKAGIVTIRDFIIFHVVHPKREANLLLGESDSRKYTRGFCFDHLYSMILVRFFHSENLNNENLSL